MKIGTNDAPDAWVLRDENGREVARSAAPIATNATGLRVSFEPNWLRGTETTVTGLDRAVERILSLFPRGEEDRTPEEDRKREDEFLRAVAEGSDDAETTLRILGHEDLKDVIRNAIVALVTGEDPDGLYAKVREVVERTVGSYYTIAR